MSVQDARALVDGICAEHVAGYTSCEARGGWSDEDGTLRDETSLIYIFYGAEEDGVKAVMNEVLKELNQSSILVEIDETECLYYVG